MRPETRQLQVVSTLVIALCALTPPALAQECPEPMGGIAARSHCFFGIAAVVIDGSTAYFGAGSRLVVADVTDPAAPQVLGAAPLPDPPLAIAVAGGRAYVSAADSSHCSATMKR